MFRVGQEVECVRTVELERYPWFDRVLYNTVLPKEGDRFTVRWCGHRDCDHGAAAVMMNELMMPDWNSIEIAFHLGYFRAITKTDISALLKLCNPRPTTTRELEWV